jgi:chemotaxis protein MotB
MNNKNWIAVAGVLLLAGIVTSVILLQQRNEARLQGRESLNQINNLEQRNVKLTQQLKNSESRLVTEISAKEDKQASLTSAENNIKELNKKIQTLNGTLAVKDKQLTESQDSLLATQEEVDSLRRDLAIASELTADLKDRLKELIAERDGIIANAKTQKTESDNLRNQVSEMEALHQKELNDRDEKISKLASDLNVSSAQLEELNKNKNMLNMKLTEANQTISELRGQLKEVISQVPELKDRLERSLKKYQVVREDLSEARESEAKLEAQQMAMKETYEALVSGLKEQLDSKEASIEKYREMLKLTFVDRILFGFSQVRISPEGKSALDKLAEVLANVPEGRIRIVGHADNIPVAEKFQYRFPSNWELSSARAAAVARHLLEQTNLEPSRIEVVGLSWYQPVAENDTEAGRAKNRRVEIIITPGP